MKRTISFLLCTICAFSLLTGCGTQKTAEATETIAPTTETITSTTDESIETTENPILIPEDEPELSEEEIAEIENEEHITDIQDENAFYFGLKGTSNEALRLVIPNDIKSICVPKFSSNFEEGWANVTLMTATEEKDLITIYITVDESYKKFENEKNYEVLDENTDYTIIWYEHEPEITDTNKNDIEQIQQKYNMIKESVILTSLQK